MITPIITIALKYKFDEEQIEFNEFEQTCLKCTETINNKFKSNNFTEYVNAINAEVSVYSAEQVYPYIDLLVILYLCFDDDNIDYNSLITSYIETVGSYITLNDNLDCAYLEKLKIYI